LLCSISPRVSETRCKLVEWERGCRKKDSMPITIRRAEAADAPRCGTILYRAFENLADYHNFPRDFPSVEAATGVVSMLLANPGFYGIVAEEGSRIIGSNFADHRSSIAGIGPISIDPDAQNQGIGRKLMQAAIDHFTAANVPGIRLVQAAYHNRSLSLYTRLGFQTREPLSVIQGPVLNVKFAGYDVRPGNEADIETCNRLCRRVHGFDRGVELREAIGAGTAIVVEHLGRITGYATDIGFFGHAVADTNQDLKSLIGAALAFQGPGFLLPTRNHEVFAWCLDSELKLVMQMTLMTIGLYNEPSGAWLPSILL
jgi:ribosomal protein S18 acetylase RimI-like enzyme